MVYWPLGVDPGSRKSASVRSVGLERWGAMTKISIKMPKFTSESKEVDWWASREGREFVKRRSAEAPKTRSTLNVSRLVGRLNRIAREGQRP